MVCDREPIGTTAPMDVAPKDSLIGKKHRSSKKDKDKESSSKTSGKSNTTSSKESVVKAYKICIRKLPTGNVENLAEFKDNVDRVFKKLCAPGESYKIEHFTPGKIRYVLFR